MIGRIVCLSIYFVSMEDKTFTLLSAQVIIRDYMR